jgi:hypothetical protein
MRAAKDGPMAENLATRSDISPSIYSRLLAQATDKVRAQLLNDAGSEQCQIITHAVDDVCREFRQTLKPEVSSDARRCVYEAYEKGKLNEGLLVEFARSGMFSETAVSLAVLTAMPIETVTNQMVGGQMSGLLVLCKSKNYTWPTAKAVVCMGHERSTADIEEARHEYYALSVQSAARALRFIGARRTLMKLAVEEDPPRPIKPEMEILMTGLDRRSGRDQRSSVDARSEEEKRLIGERRSGVQRRSAVAQRPDEAAQVSSGSGLPGPTGLSGSAASEIP